MQERDGRLRVGVTDYFQQNSGDVAFAEVVEPGTIVAIGERLATIETIKVDVELPAPVSGTVVEVNEKLELEAEIINQDSVWRWLATADRANVLGDRTSGANEPEAYYEQSHTQALEEIGKK